jgi:hypothetical protein
VLRTTFFAASVREEINSIGQLTVNIIQVIFEVSIFPELSSTKHASEMYIFNIAQFWFIENNQNYSCLLRLEPRKSAPL